MRRGPDNTIDLLPSWLFRPAAYVASWALILSALVVSILEILYSKGVFGGTVQHLLNREHGQALVWGELLLVSALVAAVGTWRNRAHVAMVGFFMCGLWYLSFSVAALHDHSEVGRPELILPVMTLTLGAMYAVLGTMKLFLIATGYALEHQKK